MTTTVYGMNLSRLRRWHWGLIVLCFFLPVVEGCNKQIVYPYLKFFDPDQWLQTTIFLYPIVLFLCVQLITKAVKPAARFAVSWGVAYVLFLALSFLIKVAVEEALPDQYCALLVVVWGITAFGLLKSRVDQQLYRLVGFFLTAMAMWVFPFAFLFSKKLLYGGWLYMYASGFIIVSYVVEFWIGPKILPLSSNRRPPCDSKI